MTNTFEEITNTTLTEITTNNLKEILVEINCELNRRRMEKKKEYYERLNKLFSEILNEGYEVYYDGYLFEDKLEII